MTTRRAQELQSSDFNSTRTKELHGQNAGEMAWPPPPSCMMGMPSETLNTPSRHITENAQGWENLPQMLGNKACYGVRSSFFCLFVFLTYLFDCTRSQLWHSGVQLLHVGSSSLTRDQIWVPFIGGLRILATGPPGNPWSSSFKMDMTGASN